MTGAGCVVLDGVELFVHRVADRFHRGDRRKSDEAGDQGVLNEGSTLLASELSQEIAQDNPTLTVSSW